MTKRLILFKTGEENAPLQSMSYHRVIDSYPVCPKGSAQECYAIEYDDGELADPAADPMVVGAYGLGSGGPEARVVWNDAIWKPASESQLRTLLTLADAVRPKPKGGDEGTKDA